MSSNALPAPLQCERLSIAFAYYVDRCDYKSLLQLFTPDGVLDRRGDLAVGIDAIERVMAARPKDIRTRHVCSNIFVRMNGERSATGNTYFTLYRGKEPGPDQSVDLTGPSFVGEYEDEFSLTDDGWKINKRAVKLIFQREPV
jgi:hypothetical protein